MHRLIAPALLLALGATTRAESPTTEGLEFFESKIRPVLVRHCYRCHSREAKRLKGGLRLDTRADVLRGGDSGRVIVPGAASKSLLMKALRYDDLRMPPSKKLPERVIADFAKWIEMGAPDPRTSTTVVKKSIDFDAARKHWAFQPIRRPELPSVQDREWACSPVDRFIQHKLEENGIEPAPHADKATQLRRLYVDLIGLPPTYEQVRAFELDDAADSWTRAVDELLASPKYGERWGRHWLDVARYADTKDLVLLYGKDRIRPFAYTYRDYVIRAFNRDLPYDQFVRDQLAADLIRPSVEPWRLSAMGLVTLGRLFCNNSHDVFDDQIDTVSRGLLGLTVSCARCHDHKYDAIPTADYYSMYGIFASSEVPIDLPLIEDAEGIPGAMETEKKLEQKRREIRQHLNAQYKEITEESRRKTGEYLHRILAEKKDPLEDAVFFLSLSPGDLKPPMLARWRRFLERRGERDDPVFGPLSEVAALADDAVAKESPGMIERWSKVEPGTAEGQVNPLILAALSKASLKSKADLAKLYGTVFTQAYEASKHPKAKPDAAREQLVSILTSPEGPVYFSKKSTYLYMTRVPRGRYHGLLLEMDKIAVHSPVVAGRARIVVDSPTPYEPRIFVRGNPRRPGERVPRRFLQVLSDKHATFENGSGRLQLANAITAKDNPLTARVIANRVWMHHFGEPLVATPNDFGTRSRPPTHPELLDYLAHYLREHDWSLKRLHRLILLSGAYRQSSLHASKRAKAVDPENRLLWRARRRRLDLESMRDSMLWISGRLSSTMHGRPVDVAGDAKNRRRTVYGLVDRQDLPQLYRAFDFASPDQSSGRRPGTTVPQQALFAMNSPFMLEQVRSIVKRSEFVSVKDDRERVRALYRIVLSRDPSPSELEIGLRFVNAPRSSQSKLSAWEQYAQVLMLTNELAFVD